MATTSEYIEYVCEQIKGIVVVKVEKVTPIPKPRKKK